MNRGLKRSINLGVKMQEAQTACTFESHVHGVEPDKSGLSHVAGKMLSKRFWVGGRECQHLFVHRQTGEYPAGERQNIVG